MTWQIHFGGHEDEWDAEREKAIANVGRKLLEELKGYGLSDARFHGNYYQENYLGPVEEAPSAPEMR